MLYKALLFWLCQSESLHFGCSCPRILCCVLQRMVADSWDGGILLGTSILTDYNLVDVAALAANEIRGPTVLPEILCL
mgnify:FL=1